MKQVLQNFKTGELKVEEVPAPIIRPGFVLVRNHYSLISTGTEGGTFKLGQMSLLGKARARPEQVKKVMKVVRTEGVMTAYQAAMRSLDMPVAFGYCCAGEVIEVGSGIDDLRLADLVACGGAGYANHAEVVAVPRNLCVQIPQGVDLRYASFTTLGSIAMQSVRVADVRLGENVVVIGLGLVGLITAQLLNAAGCKVFGIDVNPGRVQFALKHHFCRDAATRDAGNLQALVTSFSGGYGADAVIITAATPNNDPIILAGELARYKAKVIVVGRTEMTAPRETYLFKELELRTSLAYGPGTGDPTYEEQGHDYPIGYVRWTENRNMAAFLDLLATDKLQLEPLVTHQFEIEQAAEAFALVTGQTPEPSIAVVLSYPKLQKPEAAPERIKLHSTNGSYVKQPSSVVRVGVIGAGSHAINAIIPTLTNLSDIQLTGIASATGVRAKALGSKYNFAYCTADAQDILNDPQTDCVFILSRHDTHVSLTVAALEAGKHVFVEKPLAMTETELKQVFQAQRKTGLNVVVGFNRRYAALAKKLKFFFANRVQPISVTYRANVGYRPPQHWLHDPQQGGGVIIGEACHFIDFCHWLIGAPPTQVAAFMLNGADQGVINQDNVHLTLAFADGSLATVTYLSVGDASFSRERIEVVGEGGLGILEDFRSLLFARNGLKRGKRNWITQDKGFAGEIGEFIDLVRNHQPYPIPFEEYVLSTLATLEFLNAIQFNQLRPIELERLVN